jgi:hypothetical protein
MFKPYPEFNVFQAVAGAFAGPGESSFLLH